MFEYTLSTHIHTYTHVHTDIQACIHMHKPTLSVRGDKAYDY